MMCWRHDVMTQSNPWWCLASTNCFHLSDYCFFFCCFQSSQISFHLFLSRIFGLPRGIFFLLDFLPISVLSIPFVLNNTLSAHLNLLIVHPASIIVSGDPKTSLISCFSGSPYVISTSRSKFYSPNIIFVCK